jgi:23S rRNA (guanosine2251-2'-O)-methyltransferase
MADSENFLFGVNPVLEQLRGAPHAIREILIADSAQRAQTALIAKEAKQRGIRLTTVHPRALDRFAAGNRHQGVVARVEPHPYLSLGDMLKNLGPPATAQTILILDGLTDPRNFGALLRTADGAGVRYVMIGKDRSAPVTPVVAKAAAGATSHIDVVRVTNLRRALVALKENGYWVVGLDARAPETIFDHSYPPRLAVVLGSEGAGLRPLTMRECDLRVSVPMLGQVASLNVSVAGAVFLYEIVRQRRKS